MRHFLARLVDRAQGTAPRVEPLIAPQFARMSSLDFISAKEAEPPVCPASEEVKVATERQQPIVSAPEQLRAPPPPPPRSIVETEVRSEELLVPRFVAREPAARVQAIRPGDNVAPPKRTSPQPAKAANSRLAIRQAARALRSDATPRSDHFPDAPETEPEVPKVHVTIGRIEVRALQQAPAPPPKTRPASPPSLTLEAYLASREKGAR